MPAADRSASVARLPRHGLRMHSQCAASRSAARALRACGPTRTACLREVRRVDGLTLASAGPAHSAPRRTTGDLHASVARRARNFRLYAARIEVSPFIDGRHPAIQPDNGTRSHARSRAPGSIRNLESCRILSGKWTRESAYRRTAHRPRPDNPFLPDSPLPRKRIRCFRPCTQAAAQSEDSPQPS